MRTAGLKMCTVIQVHWKKKKNFKKKEKTEMLIILLKSINKHDVPLNLGQKFEPRK